MPRTIILDEGCADLSGCEPTDWRGDAARIYRLRPGEALPEHRCGMVLFTNDPGRVQAAAAAGIPSRTVKKGCEESVRAGVTEVLRAPYCCHTTRRNKAGAVEFAAPAALAAEADPLIDGLLPKVSEVNLFATIQALEAFKTRHALAPNVTAVTAWIAQAFQNVGYTAGEVHFQPFTFPNSQFAQRNVLCSKHPLDSSAILIGAHYDTISDIPMLLAPGADDNATGLAVMLEVARLLRGVALQKPILYAAFGGEEEGLFGSEECARVAKARHWPLKLMVNMDMIGWQDPARPDRIDFEYDKGNAVASNDAPAKAAALRMAKAATDYTTLKPFHSDIDRSDYMPFESKGVPCIGIFEGQENPHNHKTTDVLAHLKMSHLARIVKTLIAFLIREAR